MKRNMSDNSSGSKQMKLTYFLKLGKSDIVDPAPLTKISTSASTVSSNILGLLSANSESVSDFTTLLTVTEVRDTGTSIHKSNINKSFEPIPKSNTNKSSEPIPRKFKKSWLALLPWLEYSPETNTAKCATCNNFPALSDQTSHVVKGFSGPFKLETFKKHGKSSQHNRCSEALKAKEKPEVTPMVMSIMKADEAMISHLKNIFNCAYYIAKNNKPFSDFPNLLVLLSKCDVSILPEYNNRKACKEFISHIASVVKDDLVTNISDFVSILLDSSTDIAGEEQNILYMRYLKDGQVDESFVSLLPLQNISSDGYMKAVKNQLECLNLSELLEGDKLVGIGTDGASSMIGEQYGLVAKLSAMSGLEHIIGVHCIAHRLNLAVLSSIKEIKYLEQIDNAIVSLCKFYRKSPKRMRELNNVSKALECELLKPQYLHTVRWVASKVRALTVLVKDWRCFILHLEDISNKKGDEAATARGMLKKLKSFRSVLTAHFLIDFLDIFSQLSLIFQKKDILLSQINCHVQKAIHSLEKLEKGNGNMEDVMISGTNLKGIFQNVQLQGIDDSAFKTDRQGIIKGGIQYLREQFGNKESNKIAQATEVFDTFIWPSGTALQDFGTESLKLLANHFMLKLASPEEQEQMLTAIMDEWYEFKVIGQNLPLSDLLAKTVVMSERFPFLQKLISIVAVLPTSTASCERGFSTMNLLKNNLRSSLQSSSMNDLMMINMNGASVQDYDPTKSVEHWYLHTKGYRHIKNHK